MHLYRIILTKHVYSFIYLFFQSNQKLNIEHHRNQDNYNKENLNITKTKR